MNFLKNYFSTLSFIALAYFFYTNNERFGNFSSGNVGLQFTDFSMPIIYVFYLIIVLYIVLLIPFYIYHSDSSKARQVIRYIWKIMRGRSDTTQQEKTSLLAWIVKLFFAPLMIVWLTQHIFNTLNSAYWAQNNISLFSTDFLVFFNSHFFMLAFNTILFFDVLFFFFGYLIESPKLKNTIRSVEPTLIGWAVVMICYPPFNANLTNLVGWYSTDFPSFGNTYVHLSMNISILILMAIYAWASIALGLKASNLTNRGIVSVGPYKYIRHPAYICKNIAWLIGGIPILLASFYNSDTHTFMVLLGLVAWAFIYYMRAMTEETHLSLDPDYIKYKKKVPYKFIPKIW